MCHKTSNPLRCCFGSNVLRGLKKRASLRVTHQTHPAMSMELSEEERVLSPQQMRQIRIERLRLDNEQKSMRLEDQLSRSMRGRYKSEQRRIVIEAAALRDLGAEEGGRLNALVQEWKNAFVKIAESNQYSKQSRGALQEKLTAFWFAFYKEQGWKMVQNSAGEIEWRPYVDKADVVINTKRVVGNKRVVGDSMALGQEILAKKRKVAGQEQGQQQQAQQADAVVDLMEDVDSRQAEQGHQQQQPQQADTVIDLDEEVESRQAEQGQQQQPQQADAVIDHDLDEEVEERQAELDRQLDQQFFDDDEVVISLARRCMGTHKAERAKGIIRVECALARQKFMEMPEVADRGERTALWDLVKREASRDIEKLLCEKLGWWYGFNPFSSEWEWMRAHNPQL